MRYVSGVAVYHGCEARAEDEALLTVRRADVLPGAVFSADVDGRAWRSDLRENFADREERDLSAVRCSGLT